MARIDLASGRPAAALTLTEHVLSVEAEHLQALALKAVAERRLGRPDDAGRTLARAAALDVLDWWTRDLRGEALDVEAQILADVALEYAACGQTDDALRLWAAAEERDLTQPVLGQVRLGPLVDYHRARLLAGLGRQVEALAALERAEGGDQTLCFPGRLADALTLEWAIQSNPSDRTASALLGHWLYGQGRHLDAVAAWRSADPDDVVVARNLGMASWNVLDDPEGAIRWYEHALTLAPDDARLLSERDQLARRLGEAPAARLARLDARPRLVQERDDLCAQRALLLTLVGAPQEAVAVLAGRTFQPWEGGEGVVLGAWDFAQLALAQQALARSDGAAAERAVRAALSPPAGLGEDRHLLANAADLWLALGNAFALQGASSKAQEAWLTAATFEGDFQDMAPTDVSEKTVFSALAWRRLGEAARAADLVARMEKAAEQAEVEKVSIDYFATSLPTLLLFTDDLTARRRTTADVLRAQVAVTRGEGSEARSWLDRVRKIDPGNVAAHLVAVQLGEVGPNHA